MHLEGEAAEMVTACYTHELHLISGSTPCAEWKPSVTCCCTHASGRDTTEQQSTCRDALRCVEKTVLNIVLALLPGPFRGRVYSFRARSADLLQPRDVRTFVRPSGAARSQFVE